MNLRLAVLAASLALPLFADPGHLPLATGNSWTYKASNGQGTFTITIDGTTQINGNTYYTLTGYVTKSVPVRFHDDGNLYYRDRDRNRDVLLTAFEPSHAAFFDAPLRVCNEEGMPQRKPAAYSGPAGNFSSTLLIRYLVFSCADAGDIQEHYMLHIGMLERTTQTFTGPRQFDLIAAKVGSMAIQTTASSSLSVSLQSGAGDAHLLATIKLQVTGGDPLTLRFAGGQEFDLILRSPSGAPAWQWSTNQAFTQPAHDLTTHSHTWTAQVPLTDLLGNRLPAGTYTLEAWLTTDTTHPQFAVVAPITIGTK